MGKAIYREPTPDDPRKRITRTDEEKRDCIMYFRVSRRELDEIYRYSRSRKATMSYMIREALQQTYPEIFKDELNRHITKPMKTVEIEVPTKILKSLADGSVTILDPDT